jgi:hypothetical protein
MQLNELSHEVIGAAIEIHKNWVLGCWSQPIEDVWPRVVFERYSVRERVSAAAGV